MQALRRLALARAPWPVAVLHAVAIFGWVNRLMRNLGEPIEPAAYGMVALEGPSQWASKAGLHCRCDMATCGAAHKAQSFRQRAAARREPR